MIRSRLYVLWHSAAVQADESRSESRFNPYHGKDGKFTNSPGGAPTSESVDVEGDGGPNPELDAGTLSLLRPESADPMLAEYDWKKTEELSGLIGDSGEAGAAYISTVRELQVSTHRFRHVLSGGEVARDGDEEKLHVITQAMGHYRDLYDVPDLYRGVRSFDPDSHPVGSHLDMALASFTDNDIVAYDFSSKGSWGDNAAIFKLRGGPAGKGPAALPIMNTSYSEQLFYEREWLSNGKFKIVDFNDKVDPPEVTIEQEKNYVAD